MEKKSLHGVGDLVIFNETAEFGNKNDRLLHIHAVRCKKCAKTSKEQHWYAGYLLEIGKYESQGLPQIPIFATTLTNASENQLKSLKDLKIQFNPWQ